MANDIQGDIAKASVGIEYGKAEFEGLGEMGQAGTR